MKKFYAIACFLFLFLSASAQTTFYVDSSRPAMGNGASWNTAYKELREAITAANGQTGAVQILVAKGTYKPTTSTRQDTSFALLRGGLKLIGGYATGGGVRNAALYPTVLSGDIGTVNNNSDNSYHVVVIARIAASADSLVVDGFTIIRGNANSIGFKIYNGEGVYNGSGGGIAIQRGGGSKVSLRNCTLTGNSADDLGGGMYIVDSSPTITNSTLTGNYADNDGGGMYMNVSSPTITNCSLTGNSVGNLGGGMYMESSSPTITNCALTGNTAYGDGGGMYITNNSSPTLTNCTLAGNGSDDYGGGGLCIIESSPTITNCTLTGNFANSDGGGMLIVSESLPTITNCTLTGNSAMRGGGMYMRSSSPTITNCTLTGNSVGNLLGGGGSGGGIYIVDNSSPKITNCIIWANTATSGASIFISNTGSTSTPIVIYSIVQSGYSGIGNLNTDPKFVNPADPDGADNAYGTADDGLRLQTSSPAINAGNKGSLAAGIATDITGAARIQGGQVDMGAYESSLSPTILYVDINIATPGNGSSWASAYKEVRDALAYAAASTSVDTILVAQGTYKPTSSTRRDTSFVLLRGGLKLIGGYATGGGVRNATLYPTILSGDIGTANDNSDNSYHVMVIAGIAASADSLVVDGFTVTRGNANGSAIKNYNGESIFNNGGGGIAIKSGGGSKVSLRNCTLTDNSADVYGGGINMEKSSSTITNCILSGNSAGIGGGGGMYMEISSPIITNCTLTGNSSDYGGGGMYMEISSPTLTNCTLTGNSADRGAGMYMDNSSPAITNCTLTGNSAGSEGGGGMYMESSSPTITNCVLTGNNAGDGGGMYIGSSSPTITNCILTGNSANRGAGMYIFFTSFPAITNCTLTGNSADRGGGMFIDDSSPTLTNCIIWANTAPSGGSIFLQSSTPVVTYSIVQGGFTGTGNLNADPKFVDPTDRDGPDNIYGTADDGLRLKVGSVAINTGNTAAVPPGITTDITGAARVQQGTVDRGAYESVYPSITKYYVDNSITTGGSGDTWATAFKEMSDAVSIAAVNPAVDSILVAKGTYEPTPDANRDAAFVLSRGGLKLYGGYPSGGTGIRDPLANATILSGDIGTVNNTTDNSYHVVVAANIPSSADSLVVDGFMITKGNANGTATKSYNGQTVNQSGGAGVAFKSVSNKTVFRNCVFSSNISTGNGGVAFNFSASPSFFNCLLVGNKAAYGGALFNDMLSSPVITNCTLARDTATTNGGAMYNDNSSNPIITNCIIWDNTAGANTTIGNSSSNPQVKTSIIQTSVFPGNGNLNTDPIFVNPNNPAGTDGIFGTTDDGLRLQQCSPAINSASLAALPAGVAFDISGFTRVFNTLPDMGAYEYRAIGEGSSLGVNGDDSTYTIRTGVMPLLEQGCRIVGRVTANGTSPISGTLASRLRIDASFPTYNSQPFIKRHFQFSPSNGTTATLTLYATQQEFTDFNVTAINDLPASPTDAEGIARLRIYKFTGQSSDGTGLPATYAQPPLEINPDDAQVVWNVNQQRWQITFTVTGFSGFFIGAANSAILPLTLLQFKATVATGKEALLSWRTANEVNTSHFELQRSSDGRSFTTITVTQATGTAQGEAAYSYSDNNLQPGLYYYRLRLVDKDGKETYSQVVSVQFRESNPIVLYPVPAKETLWLGGSSVTQRGKSALLTDIQGRVLQHIRITQWPQRLDLSALARGAYLLKMEGETAVPFMKQ